MIILDDDLELAYQHVDPRIHQYSGKSDDWLCDKYGRRLANETADENIVDIIKEIMALGIYLGDISTGYGEL